MNQIDSDGLLPHLSTSVRVPKLLDVTCSVVIYDDLYLMELSADIYDQMLFGWLDQISHQCFLQRALVHGNWDFVTGLSDFVTSTPNLPVFFSKMSWKSLTWCDDPLRDSSFNDLTVYQQNFACRFYSWRVLLFHKLFTILKCSFLCTLISSSTHFDKKY